MTRIALAEMKMLVRNRLVALCSLFIPVFFAAVLIATQDNFGGAGPVATILVLVMAAMGVYITATTTLAARRQSLTLKQMRSTRASDTSILMGMLTPVAVISALQIGIILAVLSAVGSAPSNPLLVGVGVLLAVITFSAFALLTSAGTRSAEHAQFTTLPFFLITLGVGMWVALAGTAEYTFLKRVVPGGSLAELVSGAWSGAAVGDLMALLGPTVAWIAVPVIVGLQLFRWEPRN